MHLILALLTLCLLLPTLALADAIGPPPEKCPPGSVGVSSHEGDWCQPATCLLDTTCDDGAKCRPGVGLCVTHEVVPCGGLRPVEMEPCTTTRDEAHKPCAADADCAQGTCEVASRCVESWNPLRIKKTDGKEGCGCGRDSAPDGLGAALLLGLLLLRLRRR
jgi:hypothetical protein